MTNIKELRRLAQAATPGPDGVSLNWLKLLQDFQKEANPAAINELLDRLEAAEAKKDSYKTAFEISENTVRDLTEKVIPNIRNKLEAAEKDIILKEKIIDSIGSILTKVVNERDELRAKVEAMEKQESVVEVMCEPDYWSGGHFHKGYRPDIPSQQLAKLKIGSKLYLAPGAKGEPK